jgi:DNA invertase Pin-like site-specific DNA recombinase
MLGIYCRTSKERDLETSTISQQRTAGIKFAEGHKFEYVIYEDEGKSGFKISDDDQDPFNNRPSFMNLINDIKEKKIDKVWVWEHSRLSRNQYASAFIFNVFEKYNITLYENQKQFDLNDPQLKFTRQILDAVSEYERQLIVGRTTRGLHKAINEGKRTYSKLYGYQSNGKGKDGRVVFVPVESEINNYKYAFKRYMEGATLMKICYEIYDMNKLGKGQLPNYAFNLGKQLRLYQYTGYQLTLEGVNILKKFRRNEIESIKVLLDRKYWVKSIPYPLEIISIEDWVTVCERLQIRGRKIDVTRKERILRASKDIATGIIECGNCGKRYYYHEQKAKKNKAGDIGFYLSYFHIATINGHICDQRPRSYKLDHINEIFKIFYFYFSLVFDNKNELTKESQRNIKQTQVKLKEEMDKSEKQISIFENRIEKLKRVMDRQGTDDLLEIVLRNIKQSEDRLNELNIELSKSKIECELQNEKFNQTLLEMTYYDVKQKINDWFFKLNVEEQRNELIRTIKSCKIFNHHLIIDTGKTVFLFNIEKHYVFDTSLLDNLNKDKIYKAHFVNGENEKEIRRQKTKLLIVHIDFNKNKERRALTFKYLFEKCNIVYNLNETANFVDFTSSRGLYMIEKLESDKKD